MRRTELEKTQIVILGGGFAGVRAALDLAEYLADDRRYEIIVVDRKNYHLYHPGLYEAATTEHRFLAARKVKATVTIPFEQIFGSTRVKVFQGYVEGIELADGKIVTDSRVIYFDYLVIGLGSIADFYGIDTIAKYGFALKSLEDAVMIRNRIEDIVANRNTGSIVVGGGGFTGTEFAGEVHNLIQLEAKHHGKDPRKFSVTVVEGGTNYLCNLSDKVAAAVAARLNRLGVQARFSTLVTEAGKDYVMLNQRERLPCDLLIWTGGVRSVRLPVSPPADADLDRDKKDRTAVTEYLNLKNFPKVFLAGDNAGVIDPATNKPLPQTAQEAIRQGRMVAKNIFRSIRRRPLLAYEPGPTRCIIPVGGKYAVLYSPNLILSGFLGWLIRRAADLRYFLSVLSWGTAVRFWFFANSIFTKND